jgi:SAM-dependent methyltransferase
MLPHSRDNYICGETPCITLRTILRNLDIKPGDLFIDLGCGRGQTVYYARLLFDMKAAGYDLIATFILKAKLINCFLKISGVDFIMDNILNAELGSAKVVYIVPTTFAADFLEEVNNKLQEAPPGAYIVSVTRPLDESRYELIRKDSLLYSWGRSPVYYYVRK